MRVCVVGGGFTGTLTAIAIKKHCPEVHVTMIDSDREPRNLGFGESGPPDLLNSLIRALKIPPQLQTAWLTDWLKETHSVIKYNFKWQNFLDKTDKGYYSGLPDMPSYLAILDPSHIGNGLKDSIKYPDHKEYMLYDLVMHSILQHIDQSLYSNILMRERPTIRINLPTIMSF